MRQRRQLQRLCRNMATATQISQSAHLTDPVRLEIYGWRKLVGAVCRFEGLSGLPQDFPSSATLQ
ncbi:MAG: hypothetical protein CMJ70_07695 [Planctomycetaceae bacterium]|nr:hypothetical protein [Planctomycetaceae bacterium]HAA68039.1 hypothetical protein [Planctomycetaceae bacterium]